MNYLPYGISTSDGHDEEWSYYETKEDAYQMFEIMQTYEDDIHLFELNDNNEYEVIDSYWDGEL